jgi:hypothetical protein
VPGPVVRESDPGGMSEAADQMSLRQRQSPNQREFECFQSSPSGLVPRSSESDDPVRLTNNILPVVAAPSPDSYLHQTTRPDAGPAIDQSPLCLACGGPTTGQPGKGDDPQVLVCVSTKCGACRFRWTPKPRVRGGGD